MGKEKDLDRFSSLKAFGLLASVATIVALLLSVPSGYRRYVLVPIPFLAIWLAKELVDDRFSVWGSGLSRFRPSFPPGENQQIFEEVEGEYCYLGVSFAELPLLMHWFQNAPRSVRVRLLLTSPEALDALRFQAEYASDPNSLSEESLAAGMKQFQHGIERARSWRRGLPPGTLVEVRHHKERLRKWMCLVDGKTIYVGLLGKGRSDGSEPILVLRAGKRAWNLFDYYKEEWEQLWKEAEPLDPPGLHGALDAAKFHAEVAKNPDAKMRISLLKRLEPPSAEVQGCIEALLSEEFLTHDSEEVRCETARLLQRIEARIGTMRGIVRLKLGDLMTRDFCVKVQMACLDASCSSLTARISRRW